jgi:hypothetical protein
MHLERPPVSPQQGPLAGRIAPDADAAAIAQAVVDCWRDVEAALSPIIGQRGVLAIYHRCMHVASATYVWLPRTPADPAAPMDLAALQTLFAQQPVAQALACGHEALLGFEHILSSLIGLSLAHRLLRAAWGAPAGGTPTQDAS